MAVRIVRLGTARAPREGLRIGTVRRPPRGVKKADFSRRDYYDIWFPNLAPSDALLKKYFPISDVKTWAAFKRGFVQEMKQAGPARDLDLLAALSKQTNFSIGCYCEHASYCHRSILKEMLESREAIIEQ
ncbi:MAG: DUF488 domain-containing protein [Gammaproteobacteria bacterium]